MNSKRKISKTASSRRLPSINRRRNSVKKNKPKSADAPRRRRRSAPSSLTTPKRVSLLSVHKRKVRKMKKKVIGKSFHKTITKKPVQVSPVATKSFMNNYELLLPNMAPSKKALKKFHPIVKKVSKINFSVEFSDMFTTFLHPLRLVFPECGSQELDVIAPSEMILNSLFRKMESSYEVKGANMNVKLDDLLAELDLGALIHQYRVCNELKEGEVRGAEWEKKTGDHHDEKALKSLLMENSKKKNVRDVNYVLNELSRVLDHEKRHQFGEAIAILENILKKAKKSGTKELFPLLFNWIGCNYMFMLMNPETPVEELKTCFVKAMQFHKLHLKVGGTKEEKASALTNMGITCLMGGQMCKSVAIFQKAIALCMGGFVKIAAVSNLILAFILTKTCLDFVSLVLTQLFVKSNQKKKCQIIVANILLGHLSAMRKDKKSAPTYFACAYEMSSKQNKFLRRYTKECCLRSVM